MLDGLRTASKSWFGKAIMTIVFGVIIVSFAIWGIGDIFRGFGQGKLGTVGSVEISSEAYRYAYQTELQRLQQRARRVVTNDEARQAGIDRQVLGRLVTEAALDQKAHSLGLAMSDEQLRKSVEDDPAFKDSTGAFDRLRFDAILRDNGLNERTFAREQKAIYLRREIGEALAGALEAPQAMISAVDRYRNQARSVDYVLLTPSTAGEAPQPSDDELKKFYEDRKARFVAPQYRKIVTLAVTPTTAAKPQDVSDADAQKLYDTVKESRFGTPEKRDIQQIVFPNEADAKVAYDRIKGGATFEAIAAERKLTTKDIDLGSLSRAQVSDPAIAEAAFALKSGEVSAPIAGKFGVALVRVAQTTPAVVRPFADVAAEIKAEIARDRAKKSVQVLHDKIEDQRASGKPLAEAAKAAGLEARTVEAIDERGVDRNGLPVPDLVASADVVRAVFASDIGVDNETISTKDNGYVWFEVQKVDPSRQLTFDEVKDKVAAAFRADANDKKLADKAAEIVKKLKDGAQLSKIAADDKLELKHNSNVRRTGADGFEPQAIVAVFNQPDHGAGTISAPGGRMVFQILDTATPDFNPDSDANREMAKQLRALVADDLLTEYVARLQKEYGVRINEAAVRAATGGAEQ
ncbi:MAG: SurA N-terminal domain-containing protein [Rhodoblastus sp.]|nr:SurA N-terminal domain-containing protein [Rhodoblastus sp.]